MLAEPPLPLPLLGHIQKWGVTATPLATKEKEDGMNRRREGKTHARGTVSLRVAEKSQILNETHLNLESRKWGVGPANKAAPSFLC